MLNDNGVTLSGNDKIKDFVLVDNAVCACGERLHCGIGYYRANAAMYAIMTFYVKCMSYCGSYTFDQLIPDKQLTLPTQRPEDLFLGD